MNRVFALAVLLLELVRSLVAAEPVIAHFPKEPRSGDKVVIRLEPPAEIEAPVLEYQVIMPGSYIARSDAAFEKTWASIPMQSLGSGTGRRFEAEIPSHVQSHRSLVRYRIRGANGFRLPPAQDSEPNYAYFVYDGIPPWNAAIDPSSRDARKNTAVQFPGEVMGQVQTYFFISRNEDVENVTWKQQEHGNEYRYTGTFVADGVVYDHVRFRARGGVWRFAMGKNMWKFNFNKGHHLEAKDDYGSRYRSKWGKLNLRACIQQGDYGRRGEQGMYESVGFRLFNLVGVDAPRTHWVTLRIVSGKEETPSSQYQGDFWGLYLAIENEDGDFLKEHDLPDGSVYKMMFGRGELSHAGKGQPADGLDIQKFLGDLRRSPDEAWWRRNVDLPRYYSYRSIVEAIHHYDIGDGKNYDFYCNPSTGRWCVIPWDIDLTWGDHMYGSGRDPFYSALRNRPLQVEYQNRLREIRDLLFNPPETGRLIDECAAIISQPAGLSIVDADRMKWDYHPIMSSGHAMQAKAGKGLFYEGARTGTFAGMVAQMKDYVKRRSSYIDRSLLTDRDIPPKPVITYTGAPGFPIGSLSFKAASGDPSEIAFTRWRVGQIDQGPIDGKPQRAGHYEIRARWESETFHGFHEAVQIPPANLEPDATYRARCRVQNRTGRWSHWSDPIEFTVAAAR